MASLNRCALLSANHSFMETRLDRACIFVTFLENNHVEVTAMLLYVQLACFMRPTCETRYRTHAAVCPVVSKPPKNITPNSGSR